MNYGGQRSASIVAEGFGDRAGSITINFREYKSLELLNSMTARFGPTVHIGTGGA